MARLPRLTLPGYLHHTTQRGNNQQPIVVDDVDRTTWVGLLAENTQKHGVMLHAYVLLDNGFQLLVTPETGEGVPAMMQALGRRYVRYFNDRHGRTGTLWEGRYRSTIVQAEQYLMPCMAHLDLSPVQDGLVTDPRDYLWSSCRHYTGRTAERCLSPHPLYWQLGNTPFAREAAYAEMVHSGLSAAQQRAITGALMHGWALGDPGFTAALQMQTDRRVTQARPGRPRAKPVQAVAE